MCASCMYYSNLFRSYYLMLSILIYSIILSSSFQNKQQKLKDSKGKKKVAGSEESSSEAKGEKKPKTEAEKKAERKKQKDLKSQRQKKNKTESVYDLGVQGSKRRQEMK